MHMDLEDIIRLVDYEAVSYCAEVVAIGPYIGIGRKFIYYEYRVICEGYLFVREDAELGFSGILEIHTGLLSCR